jgi:hypothetical protein
VEFGKKYGSVLVTAMTVFRCSSTFSKLKMKGKELFLLMFRIPAANPKYRERPVSQSIKNDEMTIQSFKKNLQYQDHQREESEG